MKRFRNILLVTDANGPDANAVKTATGLATSNSAELTVLVVTKELPKHLLRFAPPALEEASAQTLADYMDDLNSQLSATGVKASVKQITGKLFVEAVREVVSGKRDLVVKSVRPEVGLRSLMLGSSDMHILRKCPCPVWLVPEEGEFGIQKIVAAVDFNELDPDWDKDSEPLNRKILELANSLARKNDAELHIVHAWNAVGEDLMRSTRVQSTEEEIEAFLNSYRDMHEEWLKKLLKKAEGWMSEEGVSQTSLHIHLPKGDPGSELPRLADQIDADLVVMGTLARAGISGVLMGNTAETVLHSIGCSVLAVKPDNFKSPIELD